MRDKITKDLFHKLKRLDVMSVKSKQVELVLKMFEGDRLMTMN